MANAEMIFQLTGKIGTNLSVVEGLNDLKKPFQKLSSVTLIKEGVSTIIKLKCLLTGDC